MVTSTWPSVRRPCANSSTTLTTKASVGRPSRTDEQVKEFHKGPHRRGGFFTGRSRAMQSAEAVTLMPSLIFLLRTSQQWFTVLFSGPNNPQELPPPLGDVEHHLVHGFLGPFESIWELPVKIPTSAFDSLTLISLYVGLAKFWQFQDVFTWFFFIIGKAKSPPYFYFRLILPTDLKRVPRADTLRDLVTLTFDVWPWRDVIRGGSRVQSIH